MCVYICIYINLYVCMYGFTCITYIITGDPAAVATFEGWLRQRATIEESLRSFCVRDWGSTAPFHHASLLAGVCEVCT